VAGSLSAKRLEYFAGSKVLACDRSNFTSPVAPGRNSEKEWSSNLFQLAQRFVAVKAMVVRWIKVGKPGGIRHGQLKKTETIETLGVERPVIHIVFMVRNSKKDSGSFPTGRSGIWFEPEYSFRRVIFSKNGLYHKSPFRRTTHGPDPQRSALASRSGSWRTRVDAAKGRRATESKINRELTPHTSGRNASTARQVMM
jgi:hypothetical protein